MEKHRGCQRLQLISDADVRTKGSLVHGKVENISMSGLLLRADAEVQIGDRSEISIYLPNVSFRKTLVVDGIVVRVDEHGIAYRFQNIHVDTFTLLRAIFQNRTLLSKAAA